ncbi:MerR family transcriptional regulator [Actinosynnema sp. NPDC023587]|uniref:helix-turn-helix domain-containing protein n=1 Tax=Actinosynnema sp. NPDC023587 TaxID=3154695 RepID=UPI0034107816
MDETSVRIGEAAALYGLAPSTLRWWEKQGVLAPPDRDGGRRLYRDHDLRRIGLAYLCCVTGGMLLDDAAVVASGSGDLHTWQGAVREQVARLQRRMGELQAAHDYLRSLLRCTDDDLAQCRYLDGELVSRTPRGRAEDQDLVAAARAAIGIAPGESSPVRDENRPAPFDETPAVCEACALPVVRHTRGRPRKYCSHACQQRAYRRRKRHVARHAPLN